MNVDSSQLSCEMRRGSVRAGVARLLNSVEERFPSALRSFLSIFDQAIVSGTSFLTAAIVGRTTSPEDLGLYYFLLSIVVIVSGIQGQLVTSPYVVYSKRREGSELAEYTGSVWFHHLIFTVIVAVVVILAITCCFATGRSWMLPSLWVLLGAGPFLLLRDGIRRFTFANLQVRTAILLDAIVAACQLCGLLLLGYFELMSIFAIYAAMGVACALACFGWYLLERPSVQFVRKRLHADWRHNWNFGKWALRSYLVGGTTSYFVLWILGLAIGIGAAGVFGACDNLIGMTNVVVFGVGNILGPLAAQAFAKGGSHDLRCILINAAAFLVLALGGLGLLILLTGDWLAVLVFGPSFRGTGAILLILALNALLNGLGTVAGSGLCAIDRPRSNFFADAVVMSVTLIAAACLIVPFGALGAAVTVLSGTLAGCVTRTIALFHHVGEGALESNVSCVTQLSS